MDDGPSFFSFFPRSPLEGFLHRRAVSSHAANLLPDLPLARKESGPRITARGTKTVELWNIGASRAAANGRVTSR